MRRSYVRPGAGPETFFSGLRDSVWSKSKGGGGGVVAAPLDPPLSRLRCFQGLMEFYVCEAYEPAYQTILRIAYLFYWVYRVYLHELRE